MAKKKATEYPVYQPIGEGELVRIPQAPGGKAKVFLLVDCWAGKCGEVLELDAAEVASLVASGEGDDHQDAISAHE